MKRLITFILILFVSGCSSSNNQVSTIRIKGSDTMLQLTEALAREYMRQNKDVSIYVEGGGSASGISSLINNEVDIATASRLLRTDEAKSLAEYYGSIGLYFLIAKDALSIFVNEKNSVKNLTMEQLKKIFTCEITNWKELGGKDESVNGVIRNPNSGTYLYFKEHILEGEEYCDSLVVLPTTAAIVEFVKNNENAIGYGGIGYGEDSINATVEGIAPTEQNARNDTYPITRYLHLFTSRSPQGVVKNFIDWVLSPAGQAVIKQAGFIPLWEIPS